MSAREWIIAFMAALAGFDACAVWWIYTLDRDRKHWERSRQTWADRVK